MAVDPERLLARQSWDVLRSLIPGDSSQVEQRLGALQAYAKLLLEWNRGVSNLISRHDEARLVDRHLAESLAPAALMLERGVSRVLDLGSGAGLPGLPLAIAGVGEHWAMVESRRNKTLFMRKFIQDNGMKGIDVVLGRLESLIEEEPQRTKCDAFTSRATMTAGPTLELAAACVSPGGWAFLWKGSRFEEEMRATESEWQRNWRFERAVQLLSSPNVVAIFQRKQ